MFKKKENAINSKGPAYDLIFGVNLSDLGLEGNIRLSPYVYEGTVHMQCDKIAEDEGTVNGAVALYRYNSKLGTVEKLPMPTPAELNKVTQQQNFVYNPTSHLKLSTNDQSPDGFTLAAPNWVKVNPISNVLGNISLFFLTGGFQDILEREHFPRLTKGATSILLKGKNDILKNEADDAYLLGWVISQD